MERRPGLGSGEYRGIDERRGKSRGGGGNHYENDGEVKEEKPESVTSDAPGSGRKQVE